MSAEDLLLETKINLTYAALVKATTPAGRRVSFDQMRDLIAQRSPAQIERMERERGLRG